MITISQRQLDAELSRLSLNLARYVDRLGLDAKTVVKKQSELLMVEAAAQLPPKNKSALEKKIVRDVGSVFAKEPTKRLRGNQALGKDLRWLYASPDVVVGVEHGLYRPNVDAQQMRSMYKARSGKMGKRWTRLGTRGNQHVDRLNRVVVKPSAFKGFVRMQSGKVGKLKASFVYGLKKFGRTVPRWIMRHVDSGAAKGAFVDDLATVGKPSVTIISRQSGCESAAARAAIHRAAVIRGKKITLDIKNWFKHRKNERTR